MTLAPYESKELQSYRAAARELSTYKDEAVKFANQAAETGDLDAARAALDTLQLKTRELDMDSLRKKLSPKDLLILNYRVAAIDEHTVAFTIPPGVSRMQILVEVDSHLRLLSSDKPFWERSRQFTRTDSAPYTVCIRACIPGGETRFHNLHKQDRFLRRAGLVMPQMEDLAVAFAVFRLATGRSLFGLAEDGGGVVTPWVRGAGGMLLYGALGLRERMADETFKNSIVHASAVVPFDLNVPHSIQQPCAEVARSAQGLWGRLSSLRRLIVEGFGR